MSEFHLPGYYWFLENELETFPQPPFPEWLLHLINIMFRVFYDSSFRVMGYQELLHKVLQVATPHEELNYEPYIKHFYNRQLITQITAKPIPTTEQYITIPLKREPARELQMDILALNQYFREVNYNIRYLVVIVDIYSRFVWAAPVGQLTVSKVTSALFYAFSRPGISKDYFDRMRDMVRAVTLDGGSEFKKDFPTTLTHLFPNAKVGVSPPKNITFNRPTKTGPIESAIRLLRKLLRDYSLQHQTNILGSRLNAESDQQTDQQHGLNEILSASNSMERGVLSGKSPNQVAQNIIEGKEEETQLLTGHMIDHRQHQLEKKREMETKDFPIITNPRQGYGYRLFIPASAFPKEVDFKMSLELYLIDSYNSDKVTLRDIHTGELKKETTWQSLVLVKGPVEMGPPQIYRSIKQLEEKWGFQKPSPKQMITPYEISPTIRSAMETPGKSNPALEVHPGNQPQRQSTRSGRFTGSYTA